MRRPYGMEPPKQTKHHYPTPRQLDQIAAKQSPLHATVAEGGGVLIVAPRLRLSMPGRGCGSPLPVVGTGGAAPCGVFVTGLDGERAEHLCSYCEEN